MARSTSGLSRQLFTLVFTGSNPVRATIKSYWTVVEWTNTQNCKFCASATAVRIRPVQQLL